MKILEKLEAITRRADEQHREWSRVLGDYPVEIVDLIIFHKLHIAMPLKRATRAFRALRESFVDWNEVRVSTVREIQDGIGGGAEYLATAVFIKDTLEFIHREHQHVSLEFLAEENLTEIRRYLKQLKGLDSSTVSLVLRVRKEHPVLPISRDMETVIHRIGILGPQLTHDSKEKKLHQMLEPESALRVHHFLLDHSQECCPPQDEALECFRCTIRPLCAYYARLSPAAKAAMNAGATNRTEAKGPCARASEPKNGGLREQRAPSAAIVSGKPTAIVSGKPTVNASAKSRVKARGSRRPRPASQSRGEGASSPSHRRPRFRPRLPYPRAG